MQNAGSFDGFPKKPIFFAVITGTSLGCLLGQILQAPPTLIFILALGFAASLGIGIIARHRV